MTFGALFKGVMGGMMVHTGEESPLALLPSSSCLDNGPVSDIAREFTSLFKYIYARATNDDETS